LIKGIGVDLVSIPRIAEIWDKHGERFAQRILTDVELPAFNSSHAPARLLAKRFAAKEAFSKALGTGIRPPMGFHTVSIQHNNLGQPQLLVHGDLVSYLEEKGITDMHLSLSDEVEAVVAFVVLEGPSA
jgi:holo-[acyl-carrier protein] synthase